MLRKKMLEKFERDEELEPQNVHNKLLMHICNEVEVRWQQRQDGRLLTIIGRVEHVDPDRPKRVRLEGYKNYREFLRTITPHSTSMISNDTQSSSEYS